MVKKFRHKLSDIYLTALWGSGKKSEQTKNEDRSCLKNFIRIDYFYWWTLGDTAKKLFPILHLRKKKKNINHV